MSNVRRFGDYVLLKKIATGGMAELFKAKKSGEKGFEKMLAIKMILPHLSTNDDFISMFIDEAKVAALLNHQNIVQIFDLGKIEKSYCIVMEYVRGKDLRTVIRRAVKKKSPLSPEHACLVTSSILAGLGYAHRMRDKGRELNIVHRDISPQNVIVSFEGGVKLVDFGIAKAATQSRDTQAGVLKGKLSYMSPEQAYGKQLDARSDIFSVGLVLYEMLTGDKLFKSKTDLGTLELVRNAEVGSLLSGMEGLFPKELEGVLLKALARDPDDRYQSAAEMETAVQDVMRSLGYSSSGYSLSEFMYKLFKDDIEAELEEEVRWGQTFVSDRAAEDTLRGDGGDETTPADKPRAGSGGPDTRREPSFSVRMSRSRGRGLLGRVFAGLLALILITAVGGFLGLKHYNREAWEVLRARILGIQGVGPSEAVVGGEPAEEEPFMEAQGVEEPGSVPEPEPVPEQEPAQEPRPEPVPAREPRPEPAAGVLPATLVLNSEPQGASVYLDGVYSGDSPITVGDMEPDVPHQVKMALDGYQEWTGEVSAEPGTLETLNAKLAEVTFELDVASVPEGANIYINGGDTNKTTPSVIEGLKPGLEQVVELKMSGHETYKEVVNHTGGGTATVQAVLKRLLGKLTINSKPWAFVIIDGRNKGETPIAGLELPVGEYEVELENPKLKLRKKVKVVIRPGETTRVVIPLGKKQ